MSLFESFKDILATASSTLVVVSSLFSSPHQVINHPVIYMDTAVIEATKSAQIAKSYSSSGEYTYLNQKVTYYVSFPQNGGPINGKIDGICKGDISGDYKANDSILFGKALASCRMGFISQDAKVSFNGSVNQGEKKAYLNWVGDAFLAGKRGSIVLDLTLSK